MSKSYYFGGKRFVKRFLLDAGIYFPHHNNPEVTMKIHITKKTRQALLKMGFPRQTINNWISGRVRPSRLSCAILGELTGKVYTTKRRRAA